MATWRQKDIVPVESVVSIQISDDLTRGAIMIFPPGEFSEDKILEFLRECSIDEEVSGVMESFCERYEVSNQNRAVFERFLASRSLDNRSGALESLVVYGEFDGYEADSLLLHYQSRPDISSQRIYDAISYLRRLSKRGSNVAQRLCILLDDDDFVKDMW